MEEATKQDQKTTGLKKVRFWTIFLLVITGLSTLNGLRGIPSILHPVKTNVQGSSAAVQKLADDLYQMASTTGYKIFALTQTALVVAVFILFIFAFQKLKQEKFPTQLAYGLYIFSHVVMVVQAIFLPMPTVEDFNLGSTVVVIVGLFNLILVIPAIFALVRLQQAKATQKENK